LCITIDPAIVIVPVTEWDILKDCPTEYSLEYAHCEGCKLGMANWSNDYPKNDIEKFAFERQFMYLINKGVRWRDILDKQEYDSIRETFNRHYVLLRYWHEANMKFKQQKLCT
jgi:hypothetical protein